MKVLIVEDEPRAANRLKKIIQSYSNDIEILAVLPSIEKVKQWLDCDQQPDLAFLDIQLEDGSSFELLEQCLFEVPVIFCTAYNEYALKAFSANSIDYLLKPTNQKDVFKALAKFERFTGFTVDVKSYQHLANPSLPEYRQQFLIALAGRFTPVHISEISAIQSFMKASKLIDTEGKEWLLEESLSSLEESINPANFIRVSRQYLIAIRDVAELVQTDQGYFINLRNGLSNIKVSRARVKQLKQALA